MRAENENKYLLDSLIQVEVEEDMLEGQKVEDETTWMSHMCYSFLETHKIITFSF
jgi:hypothetical protein